MCKQCVRIEATKRGHLSQCVGSHQTQRGPEAFQTLKKRDNLENNTAVYFLTLHVSPQCQLQQVRSFRQEVIGVKTVDPIDIHHNIQCARFSFLLCATSRDFSTCWPLNNEADFTVDLKYLHFV